MNGAWYNVCSVGPNARTTEILQHSRRKRIDRGLDTNLEDCLPIAQLECKIVSLRRRSLLLHPRTGTDEFKFSATEYFMSHLGVPASVGARVHLTYYPAGHMMYVNHEAIAKMKKDIDAFIDSTARE